LPVPGRRVLPLHQKVFLEQGGDDGIALALQVIAAGASAESVGHRGREPIAELMAGATVESQDQGLAVLVIPEADAGRLAFLNGACGRWLLAKVVVEAVDALGGPDEELVGGHETASASANGVRPLEVTGRLALGDSVVSWPQIEKHISAIPIGGLGKA
jgi:hypothetical protein